MPERIQLRRTKGWQMPANTVVVAIASYYQGRVQCFVPPGGI